MADLRYYNQLDTVEHDRTVDYEGFSLWSDVFYVI